MWWPSDVLLAARMRWPSYCPNLPRDFPVPVLIVQHMPPAFTRFLAQRLTSFCRLPVEEAARWRVAIAGNDLGGAGRLSHVGALRARLPAAGNNPRTRRKTPAGLRLTSCFAPWCRLIPATCWLWCLTGMGQDGLRGCELLADAGAQIIAQDEATSVVWGMPGFVAKAGLADAVVPLSEMADRIVRAGSGFATPSSRRPADVSRVASMSLAAVDFDYLRTLVKNHTAIVLDAGKEYLAETRLAPLVSEQGCASLQEFLGRLRREAFSGLHRKVLDAMTNNETWFFRDANCFRRADRRRSSRDDEAARRANAKLAIWSAACSSGQEPYSIAMALRENFNLPGWKFSILGPTSPAPFWSAPGPEFIVRWK